MTTTTPWSDTPPSEKNVEFWVQHRRTGKESIGKRISVDEWLVDDVEYFNPQSYYQFGPRVLSAEETVALTAEVERLRAAGGKLNHDVCQTLGRALGYPWFKDDPVNFPGATEANGVCVGEHVAESIASEAAKEIERLKRENAELREKLTVDDLDELERYTPPLDGEWKSSTNAPPSFGKAFLEAADIEANTGLGFGPRVLDADDTVKWTAERDEAFALVEEYHRAINPRRGELIDRKIARVATESELAELERLQALTDRMIRLVAPLPIAEMDAHIQRLKNEGKWSEE